MLLLFVSIDLTKTAEKPGWGDTVVRQKKKTAWQFTQEQLSENMDWQIGIVILAGLLVLIAKMIFFG